MLVNWRGLKIYSYPALLYAGTVLGVLGGTYAGINHGLKGPNVYLALLLLVPPALVGSRLLFVASHWNLFRHEPTRIWLRSDGGASLYGGLLLSFLFSLVVLPLLQLPIGTFWDVATITILIGMVFTKIGCMLNGCCAGRPTNGWLGLRSPNVEGVWCRRVPAQLLESALALALLGVSVAMWNHLPFGGAVFLGSLGIYASGRWVLEGTRETIDRVGMVSLHRLISVLLVAIAGGLFLFFWLYAPGTQ